MEAAHNLLDDITSNIVNRGSRLEKMLDATADLYKRFHEHDEQFEIKDQRNGGGKMYCAITKNPCKTCGGPIRLEITPGQVILRCAGVCAGVGKRNCFPATGEMDFSHLFVFLQEERLSNVLPCFPLEHLDLDGFLDEKTDLCVLMSGSKLKRVLPFYKTRIAMLRNWQQIYVLFMAKAPNLSAEHGSRLNQIFDRIGLLEMIFAKKAEICHLFYDCNELVLNWTKKPFLPTFSTSHVEQAMVKNMLDSLISAGVIRLLSKEKALVPFSPTELHLCKSVGNDSLLQHLGAPSTVCSFFRGSALSCLLQAKFSDGTTKRELVGFRDGTVDLDNFAFLPWTGQDRGRIPGLFFDELVPQEYLEQTREWQISAKIEQKEVVFEEEGDPLFGTPALDIIFGCQEFAQDQIFMILAMLGSLFMSPKKDNFQMCTVFCGKAGTGKSSIVNMITGMFQENQKLGYYKDLDKHSSSAFEGKFLLTNTETEKLKIDPNKFKKEVSNELTELRKLFKDQTFMEQIARILFSGNGSFKLPAGTDYDSILRRLLVVHFGKEVTQKIADLDTQLVKERIQIMLKAAKVYSALVRGLQRAALCDVLPKFFKDARDVYMEGTGASKKQEDAYETNPPSSKKRARKPNSTLESGRKEKQFCAEEEEENNDF